MRIALAGKGGAGKTTLAATFARLVARRGVQVVAVDADSNPNLAAALGVPAGTLTGPLPASAVSRRLDGPALQVPLDDLLDDHAVAGPDGVRIAIMGAPAHAGEGCLCAAHATVSAVLSDLGGRPDVLGLIDLEASPEHLSRGTARHVDTLLLVTEPYYRSLETIRRLARLAGELPIGRVAVLANKVRDEGEAAAVEEFCARHDLELLALLPWSDAVVSADVAGVPLLDRAPQDPVVDALGDLAATLLTAAQDHGTHPVGR